MRYMICYDLKRPEKNYPTLYKELRKVSAHRVLRSQWVFRRTNTSASKLRDHFRRFLDADDRLLITSLEDGDFASHRLLKRISEL